MGQVPGEGYPGWLPSGPRAKVGDLGGEAGCHVRGQETRSHRGGIPAERGAGKKGVEGE